MSQSTFQMIKFLRIFHYRGKSAGKRKKQAKVLDQPCFDSYVNVHAILQVPTEIIPHCSRAHFEIDSNTVEQQSQAPIMSQSLWSQMLCPSSPRLMKYKSFS